LTQNIKKYINEIISSLLDNDTIPKAFLLEKITFPLKGTFFLKGKCLPDESKYF